MSTPDTVALLAKHYTHISGRGLTATCKCGEVLGERTGPATGMSNLHRAHVAAVLDAHYADRERAADSALDDALRERDEAQDWADRLAYAIAPIEVIGEHTSHNSPWENALELAPVTQPEPSPEWVIGDGIAANQNLKILTVDPEWLADRERAAAEKALRDWVDGPLSDSVAHGQERGEPWVPWLIGIVRQGRDRADTYLRTDKEADRG